MNSFLKKDKSNIHGIGIFTSRAIQNEEAFYQVPLDRVSDQPHAHWARIDEHTYVSDDEVLNWVNHSCKPNTLLDIDKTPPRLVALRDISENEEITCDYSRTELGGVGIPCQCGSLQCRGYFLRVE